MPDGSVLQATGRVVPPIVTCIVARFADGQAIELRQYYDMLPMMLTLGAVAPAVPATA